MGVVRGKQLCELCVTETKTVGAKYYISFLDGIKCLHVLNMVAMLNANQLCDNLGFVDFNDDVQIPSSFDHERSDVPGHQHDFRHQKSQLEAWGC